jgi:flagellar hook-associated protein 2
VSDVITGVTMTLTKAGETTTLTTGVDTEAVTEKVRTFVDGVNNVLTLIKEQTQVSTVGEKVNGSVLTGNYGLQMIQQNLKSILASKGLGFDYDMAPSRRWAASASPLTRAKIRNLWHAHFR